MNENETFSGRPGRQHLHVRPLFRLIPVRIPRRQVRPEDQPDAGRFGKIRLIDLLEQLKRVPLK